MGAGAAAAGAAGGLGADMLVTRCAGAEPMQKNEAAQKVATAAAFIFLGCCDLDLGPDAKQQRSQRAQH